MKIVLLKKKIGLLINTIVSRTPTNSYNRTRNHRKKYMRGGKWSRKYKLSINCKKPKGFSQKQYCKYK